MNNGVHSLIDACIPLAFIIVVIMNTSFESTMDWCEYTTLGKSIYIGLYLIGVQKKNCIIIKSLHSPTLSFYNIYYTAIIVCCYMPIMLHYENKSI